MSDRPSAVQLENVAIANALQLEAPESRQPFPA